MLEEIIDWDTKTFIYFNSLGAEQYDFFWATLTNIFTWTPLFILFFILIGKNYPKREALFMTLWVIALALLVTALTGITKEAFQRLRPNNNIEINAFIRIVKNPGSYSFFSGHSSTSFSITTLVFLFLRNKIKWAWLFYLWPILFAYSRIYLGVHYPIDILVGATVGVISALLFYKLFHKFIKPYLTLAHP